MTDEQIAIEVTANKHEIASLRNRVDRIENSQTQINNLAISVRELALSIKQVMAEQEEQSDRLQRLEDVGTEKWNTLTKTVISCVASGIVGLVIGAIVKML